MVVLKEIPTQICFRSKIGLIIRDNLDCTIVVSG